MSANSQSRFKVGLLAAAGAVGILMATQGLGADEVQYYDKAPSAEELRKRLLGTPEVAPRTRGMPVPGSKPPATRGIVFTAPQEAAQPAPAAPAPAPIVTETRPAPQLAPAVAAPSETRPAPQATAPQAAPAFAPPAAAPAPAAPAMQASVAPAAAAAAAPGPAAAAAPGQTMQITVSQQAIAFPINFRLGSAQVVPESVSFIDTIADFMKQNPQVRLLVEGHTDATGSPERNNVLSRERAYSVTTYLIEKHRIDPTRLLAIGRGQTEPLQSLDPKHPRNRRVQFRMISGG